MKYNFNSCKSMIGELANDCTSWEEFVVRTSDFLTACLNDNDISYWEFYELEDTKSKYWLCFSH